MCPLTIEARRSLHAGVKGGHPPRHLLNVYRRPTLSALERGSPRSVGCPTTLFYMLYQSQSDENIKYRRSPPMDERIHFIYHQGKKILLVDLSKCPASEFEKLVRQVPDHVMVQPLGSVLALTDFAGAVFNRDAIRAVKETAVFDKPYIKKSALVGTETFPKDFYEELKSFSRRDLRIFRSRDEALAWLVADSVDG